MKHGKGRPAGGAKTPKPNDPSLCVPLLKTGLSCCSDRASALDYCSASA